jgi:hypothetical protein
MHLQTLPEVQIQLLIFIAEVILTTTMIYYFVNWFEKLRITLQELVWTTSSCLAPTSDFSNFSEIFLNVVVALNKYLATDSWLWV